MVDANTLDGAHPLADVREAVRPLERFPGAPLMRSLLAPNRLMIWAQTDCAFIGVGANWVAPEDVETVCAMLRSQRDWLVARRAEVRAAGNEED